ncbi:molybdenum cofactor guanylyltransferase [Nakamurella silvestris]|nr:molybdenum cofactor guanylyltransferase [Nakamurella silvestris]
MSAVILAGGSGARLGGVDKPGLALDGRSLLDRAIAAVPGGRVVVVGPPRRSVGEVIQTLEDPPGSGPAAAIAAGVIALGSRRVAEPAPADVPRSVPTIALPATSADVGKERGTETGPDDLVAVLAADLPGITSDVVRRLAGVVLATPAAAGAVLVDGRGHEQWLLGVWRSAALVTALSAHDSWAGRSVRALLQPLSPLRLPATGDEHRDLDTPADRSAWEDRLGATFGPPD